jgi:hypothetical protein
MAAIDFPNSPTVGQQFTASNSATYSWDGAVWTLAGPTGGGAAGGDLSGFYPNPTIAAGAVTTGTLNDGAVTSAKVALRNIPLASYSIVNTTLPALDGTNRMMCELNAIPVNAHWALVSYLLVARARRLASTLLASNVYGVLTRGGTPGAGDGTQILNYPFAVSSATANDFITVNASGLLIDNPGSGNFRYAVVGAQDNAPNFECLGIYARLDVALFP